MSPRLSTKISRGRHSEIFFFSLWLTGRETFKAGHKEVNQNKDWKQKYEVLELKDSLEEVKNLKETLRREMAISKGLRRTIEKLQEENKALARTTKHERVEGGKVMTSDTHELREKVHELEKENELLQQKLTKKDKELERFQGQDTGAVVDSITFCSDFCLRYPDNSLLLKRGLILM